jgi:hypothetical protein
MARQSRMFPGIPMAGHADATQQAWLSQQQGRTAWDDEAPRPRGSAPSDGFASCALTCRAIGLAQPARHRLQRLT